MSSFYKLSIKEIIKETDAVSILFNVPEELKSLSIRSWSICKLKNNIRRTKKLEEPILFVLLQKVANYE